MTYMTWMMVVAPGLGVGFGVSLAARAALRFTPKGVTNEVPPDPLEERLLLARRG